MEREAITSDGVAKFLDATRLSADAIRPYTFFHKDQYTRNLIYRDDKFEVMSICWSPGQRTVIHTHNGQLGWMTMPQGEVDIHNYKYVRCNAPENMNVVGIDCLGGATHIELDRIRTDHCVSEGPVAIVDKSQTIHQIENADPARSGVISLHVYSLPIDSCIAFDLNKQRCFRKTLRYYSKYGHVEID